MSLKTMIFIDGSWLYHNRKAIIDITDEESFEIDYSKLPALISDKIADQLDLDTDVVRTYYFGATSVNKSGHAPGKQQLFYEYLSQRCMFDVQLYDIDFKQSNKPKMDEHCVEVALATDMMFYATLPASYDIAVLIGGSLNYKPLLQRIRALGKRVQLVSIKDEKKRSVTSEELLGDVSLYDFLPIYLDLHTKDIRRKLEESLRVCEICGEEEKTTWEGTAFCCSSCRNGKRKRTRACDSCGKEESTSWNKQYFYCIDCRHKYRGNKPEEDTGSNEEGKLEEDEDLNEIEPLDAYDPTEESDD